MRRTLGRSRRRSAGDVLLNLHLAAWLGRRVLRMRRGRAPWRATTLRRR